MNIRLNVLVRLLQKHYHVTYNDRFDQSISKVQLLPESLSASALNIDTLYVTRLRTLRQLVDFPKDVPILCVVHPENIAIQKDSVLGHSTVLMVFSDSMEQVLMTLSDAMYSCGQMTSPLEDMSKALLDCKTLDEALHVGYTWLQNPLLVADSRQNILAYTETDAFANQMHNDEWLRNSIFPGPEMIGSTLDAMNNSLVSTWPDTITDPSGNTRLICKTLSSGGVVGYLLLHCTERSFQNGDTEKLELLSNFCTILLREQNLRSGSNNGADPLGQLMRILVDDATVTRAQMEQHIDRMKLRLKKYRYVLSISPSNELPNDFHPVHGILDLLVASVPCAMATYYQNTLVLVIECDDEVRDITTEWPALEEMLKNYCFRAGISNVCSDILYLKDYYHQSQRAAALGKRYFPEATLVPYYRCAPYHILELASQYQAPLTFCDPAVLTLQKLDKQNNTDLLRTLQVYLECGRNKAQTAQRLFLHLNTVKYRLNQIDEILNIQYSSLEDELRLYISLLLLQFTQANQPGMNSAPPPQDNSPY